MEYEYIKSLIWKSGVFRTDSDYPAGLPGGPPEVEPVPLNDDLAILVSSSPCGPTVDLIIMDGPYIELARLIIPSECAPQVAEMLFLVHRQTHPYDYEHVDES